MSKNKSKIVRWEYVIKPFDVKILPTAVKRVHSPLEPSSETYWAERILHLRPCVQGVDEYGVVIKYLYCTRDGRFFTRGKDGWNEIKIHQYLPAHQNYKKGSVHPYLCGYGSKHCHLCVAYAWLGARPEGMVCDHLDTNLLNWTADNLQWVTADENNRRGKIAKRMRKIGLDPKLLTPTLCKGIYSLNQYQLDVFFNGFLYICNQDPSPLSIDAIRLDVAQALDNVKEQPNPNF